MDITKTSTAKSWTVQYQYSQIMDSEQVMDSTQWDRYSQVMRQYAILVQPGHGQYNTSTARSRAVQYQYNQIMGSTVPVRAYSQLWTV